MIMKKEERPCLEEADREPTEGNSEHRDGDAPDGRSSERRSSVERHVDDRGHRGAGGCSRCVGVGPGSSSRQISAVGLPVRVVKVRSKTPDDGQSAKERSSPR